MGLKELAASVNRRPELYRHPSSEFFHTKFPIIKERVSLDDEQLIFIIRGSGDTQRHQTNVKANMTDWFMQKQHKATERYEATTPQQHGTTKLNGTRN